MSSSYTCAATVVQDPEKMQLGGKDAVKVRLVDKAMGKKGGKFEDRFFNALLFGHDAGTAGRLAKGDKILITGTLALTSYKSKKTGQKVQADEMGFGTRILRVLHSPTFFGEGSGEGGDEEAPAPAVAAAGPGPLDDLDL